VLVSRRWYGEFAAAAEGDQGGREFFARREADTSYLDYPDPISDIDTADDLRRALAGQPPPGQAGSAS
jgi:CTP:molybdopterin cytidylyltransferase MocA